jgi:hypothetical protein
MPSTVTQIAYLDGPRLRRSLLAACEYAQGQRSELNRINVFPVPDGDTGTNLSLTLRAIADHLRSVTSLEVSFVAREAAQGAVLGARGNCGMMLSHFLLGFADHVATHVRISTDDFALALHAGVERLQHALEHPVEGTILTVMRDTATAAKESNATDFVPLVTHVVERARASLARTPQLLPVLKKAGVVDAGAKGFVGLLEGVLCFVQGIPIDSEASTNGSGFDDVTLADYPADDEQYRYCTEALVRGGALPEQNVVRDELSQNGDSVIAIRSGDILKVHVHTDEPDEVFDYLRSLGALVTHKAEDMRAQHSAIGRAGGHIELARRPIAVVTDSACDLSEEIMRAHGIHVLPMSLVDGDQTYRDGIDITATRFHDMLASASVLPTTSQPPPAAIQAGFERAGEEGEEIVAIFASSTLSGAVRSAQAAATRFEAAPIRVVDSLGASLLLGLLALKAAELGELGRSADEIVAELARIRRRSGILFTVRTFDRLIASGRVGRGKALVGRFLGLKPILGLTDEGEVAAFGKALGDGRARPALLRALRERIPDGAERVRFGVVHVGVPELVEPVSDELRAAYGQHVEILSAPAAPVISTHLGIGAWGVAYMVED